MDISPLSFLRLEVWDRDVAFLHLYVLVAEVLAVNIRCNPCLPGLPLSLVVSPVHQYADMQTILRSFYQRITLSRLSLFEKVSGSRLNQYKSKGLWLGSWVGRLDPPMALDWYPTKLNIFGVYVGLDNFEEDNGCSRINTVDKALLSWRQRNVSWRQRNVSFRDKTGH